MPGMALSPKDTSALLAVTVPEHRVENAAREAVRRGLSPFCLAVGAYYVFLTGFHVVLGVDGTWPVLAGSCAVSSALFFAAAAWLQRNPISLDHAYAWVVGVSAVVLANISLYQVLGNEPRNFVNYALINVVAGSLILSRPALLMVLMVDAVAWAVTIQVAPGGDPAFDGSFLAGTWVLAIGLSHTRRRTLEQSEALRLGAEIALDRSERRLEQRDRAIVAHRRSQEGLRSLIESTMDGVLILQGGRVAYANRAFRDRLGLRREQVIDQPLSACVHPEDADLADPAFLKREARDGVELRFVDAHGEPVPYEVSSSRMEFGEGPAILLICHDPTSLDVPDQQALANRMLAVGTLAAGVAHEINNPLAYTIANLEMLQLELTDASEPSNPEDLVRVALEGANRVRDIVADLRTFSREDEEKIEAVDVEELLEVSIRMAWNEIRHRAHLVRTFSGPSAVRGNRSRLGQVFLNLLVNAAQSIADGDATGERIEVRTFQDERGVVVEVVDTGIGMSAVVQEQIFRPFYTTKPVGVGTGLGLPFCREVVAEHGGELEVDSEVGVGSTFRVILPATDEKATPSPGVDPGRPHRGPPRRVLVVDDETALADAIASVLGSDDVVVLPSGASALERLDERWDAVLCDVMMPEMSGPEFYARAVEAHPELEPRFAFITGGTFTEQTRSFLEQTRAPILVKPFRARAIRELVAQLTANGRSN